MTRDYASMGFDELHGLAITAAAGGAMLYAEATLLVDTLVSLSESRYRTAYEQLVNQVEGFLNRPDVIEHVPIMMLADLDQIVTESQIDLQHVLNPEEQNDNPAEPTVPPAPSAPALPGDSGYPEAD